MPDPLFVSRDTTVGIGNDAKDARFDLGALLQPSPASSYGFKSGVFPSQADANGNILDVVVTPVSGFTVAIGPGNYVSSRDALGPYLGAITAPTTATFDAPDSAYSRKDVLVLRCREPFVDGVAPGDVPQSAFPFVLKGVAASVPSANDALVARLPGDVLVAVVTIRGGSSSIVASDIAMQRTYVSARGGVSIRSAIDNDPPAYPGQLRTNNYALEEGVFNAGGTTSWVPIATPLYWTTFTPVLKYSGGSGGDVNLGANSAKIGYYVQVGKTLYYDYLFLWGTRPYAGGLGSIYTLLPGTFSAVFPSVGTALLQTKQNGATGYEFWNGVCDVQSASNVMYPMFHNSATDNRVNYYRIATASGGVGQSIPYIANGTAEGFRLSLSGRVMIA